MSAPGNTTDGIRDPATGATTAAPHHRKQATDLNPYQDSLVELQNTLNGAEGSLQVFFADADTRAGLEAVRALREAANLLDGLIEELDGDVDR